MPELPEVETVRRILQGVCVGKTIEGIDVFRPKNIASDPNEFVTRLQGKTIEGIGRKGKFLLFFLSESLVIVSHLRMEGKYFYQPSPEPQGKHDILRFRFTDGSALVYNDVRKFGRLQLSDQMHYLQTPPLSELGPEPFDYSPDQFKKRLSKDKRYIKQVLMDQSVIAGIGNIYCDEVLFASALHPLTPACEISEKAEEILHNAQFILNKAIEASGSTIRSYHPGKDIDGMFQLSIQAYGKENQPCPKCGFPMRRILANGRGTTFCPRCQKATHVPFVLGVTGPIHSGKSTVSRFFESKGYDLFDADVIAKQAYGDKTIQKRIKTLLGREALENGKPNTGHIRSKLIQNPALRKKLEGIIHPCVIRKAKQFIANHKPNQQIVLDVPLLFQSGMDELCDATILVLTSPEAFAQRINEEGTRGHELAKINKDWPVALVKKKASFTVYNDGSLEDLHKALESLPL
ncbi:MAG: DNA-formamidopyrimidine glycosylase [Bacilli bacterium]|nr:DNA-formamidopyrimidine glycosylase [Bacilli bacterium]